MNLQRRHLLMLAAAVVVSPALTAAAQSGKKQYTFRGTIEKIDSKENKVSVNGENVAGWMPAMTMNYKVDKPEVLKSVKAGDQITATVYEGDFETLYNVQRVAPKGQQPSEKK